MKTKLLPLLLFTFATNAFAALDTPTEDFIDNNDGTITHMPSGLVWQKCSVGQTWQTGSDFEGLTNSCLGTATTQTYDAALKLTSNFAGQTDWRVPNIRELHSLVDFDKLNPSINKTLFPKTPIDTWFWSASVNANNSSNVWIMIFSNGGENAYNGKNDYLAVRLVRGGQSFSFFTLETPTTDFLNNKDGTVTHNKTGLTWQRCAVGQTWVVEESACQGSATTFVHADAKKLTSDLAGKTDWRLPTAKELETIADYTKSSPAINTTVFPNAPSMRFWTGSYPAGLSDKSQAWVLDFATSWRWYTATTERYGVRLVRGGQSFSFVLLSFSVDLSTTLSQSSSRVKINENLTYTATVTNNGTGTANNSSLKFYLPPRNVSVISMPSDCVTTGKSITCSLGNLTAGANASRAITVSYIKSGGASLSALILTDSEDINSANNVSRIVTAIKK